MNVKVVKFGGSSLADAAHFKQVASIIKADPNRRYVVPSAPGKRFKEDIKVTDMLYRCYEMIRNHENIDEYYKQIEEREALKRERELERQLAEERGESEIGSISEQIQNLEAMPVEEVNTVADSLSTKEPMIGLSDSLAVADTVAKVLTPEEIKAAEKAAKEKAKAEKKAAKEQKAKEKQEALEAKWAEMDRRDAEKAAAKEEQRLEKERNRKRKALENAAKKAQREAELLEKYQRRYRNRKNRSNQISEDPPGYEDDAVGVDYFIVE